MRARRTASRVRASARGAHDGTAPMGDKGSRVQVVAGAGDSVEKLVHGAWVGAVPAPPTDLAPVSAVGVRAWDACYGAAGGCT